MANFYVFDFDWSAQMCKKMTDDENWCARHTMVCERIFKKPDQNIPTFHLKNVKKLTDVVVNQWLWTVFSPKMQEVLSTLTKDPIQYLDANVQAGEASIPDYKICNTLLRISAVDREKSSLRFFTPKNDEILGFNSLVLNESKIGDHSFFRLDEFIPLIIVNEQVANGIINAKCTGVKFIPVNEFSS